MFIINNTKSHENRTFIVEATDHVDVLELAWKRTKSDQVRYAIHRHVLFSKLMELLKVENCPYDPYCRYHR